MVLGPVTTVSNKPFKERTLFIAEIRETANLCPENAESSFESALEIVL